MEQDAMTLRNQQQSPLIRLPPELRNKIYEFLIGGLGPPFTMTKRFCRGSGNGSVTSKLVLYHQHPTPIDGLLDVELSLERVCRQVRNEFMHLLWTKNTFQIHANNLTELARKTGTRVRLIRKVLIYSVDKVRKDGLTGDLYLHSLLVHALRELQKCPQLEQICVPFRKSALKNTMEDAILHELKQAWKPAREGQVIDFKLKIGWRC